jgi:hypothetical protein
MGQMDRELMSMLGTVGSIVGFLVAIAVLVIGFAVVRPHHATAGVVIGGAGGVRVLGLGLTMGLGALRSSDSGLEAALAFGTISTLISMLTTAAFWGGIVYGTWLMAESRIRAGGVR